MPDPLLTAMRQLQQQIGGIVAVEVDDKPGTVIIKWFDPQAKRADSIAASLAVPGAVEAAMGELARRVGRARG